MNRFYHVTFGLMIIGLAILCFYAPWTQPEVGSVNVHQTIGWAPVWSDTFAQIPAAHVDCSGAFAAYAGAIVFFSCVWSDSVLLQREARQASHSPNESKLSRSAEAGIVQRREGANLCREIVALCETRKRC